MIRIKRVTENKKQFLDLLLLADEQEDMIDKYLSNGDLFALYDDDIILIENTTKKMRYVFSNIVASSFLWRKERMNEKGEWKTVAKVTADRK